MRDIRERLACSDFQDRLRLVMDTTAEDVMHLAKKQGFACAICREPEDTAGPLLVDHRHADSVVRGLLCHGCNILVGWLENKWYLIDRANTYINTGLTNELLDQTHTTHEQ